MPGALVLSTLAALIPMAFGPIAQAAETTSGLNVIVSERGHLSSSYDAEGSGGADGEVTVHKPVGAKVRRAVLLAATTGFTSATMPGPVAVSVEGVDSAQPSD